MFVIRRRMRLLRQAENPNDVSTFRYNHVAHSYAFLQLKRRLIHMPRGTQAVVVGNFSNDIRLFLVKVNRGC